MGCCAALLATRSSVKVQPASIRKTNHVTDSCSGRPDHNRAEPPPAASSPNQQEQRHLPLPTSAASIWSAVESKLKGMDNSHCRSKAKTTNWDTLYVYIASVYEDFAEERAFLATHVFPELRQWCSAQQLHLVPVDLRQGLTHSPDTVQFAATCLHELERYMSCKVPVCFIAFISERLGYTPLPEVLAESSVLVSRYGWIEGISLLEMEVVRAAFTRHNPNALFFYRDPSFIPKLPLDIAVKYMHTEEKDRMELLKAKVQEKYPDQVFHYMVDPTWSNVTGEVSFSGFENMLSKIVVEFFILRIKKDRPCCSPDTANTMERLEHLEQGEMERAVTANLLGRQGLMDKINEYVQSPGCSVPLVLLGEMGSGKTALLANVAKIYKDTYSTVKKTCQIQQQQASPPSGEGGKKRRFSVAGTLQSSTGGGRLRVTETDTLAKKNVRRKSDFVSPDLLQTHSPARRERVLRVNDSVLVESEDMSEETYWSPLPLMSPSLLDEQWLVFHHTVGCVPCSDELPYLLQRLWRIEGLGEPRMVDLPCNPHALSKVIQEMLATRSERKFLLIVDSIDRVKGEYPSDVIKWIPMVLPPSVRIIVSLQPTSEARKLLASQDPPCLELTNGPLGLVQSKHLLRHALQHYNVPPTPELLEILLNKHGISNPHYVWELCRMLSITMETQLQVPSESESAMELAKVLPNELLGLHDHLLRTVEEAQGKVAIAAVCLLQCARHGLSEVELLEMLGTLFEHGEQATKTGESSSQRLHHPSTESALISSHKCSSSDAISWAGSDAERLSLTESHLSSVGLAKSRQELHLPLPGPNAPNLGYRLSPRYSRRKISGISVTSTPPDWPRSHSPLLMPATPDFTKFGATPSPSSVRARHSHHSLSLTPSPNRLSPLPGPKPVISPPMDTHPTEELHCGLPPAEIEEIVEHKTERSSRLIPPEAPPPRRTNRKLLPLEWAMLLRQLQPFVRNIGKADCFHWVISNRAFSRAIARRYFKNPPTQSFPFAFSSTFCGARDDHSTLHHMSAKGGGGDVLVGAGLSSSRQSDRSSVSDTVQRRYIWWHARLAWYFETCCVDLRRRSEELPYHVMQLQNYGRLSKCLSSLQLLQHLSSPFTEMDLLRYWHCAGGANCAVTAYSQALASLEISGASSQELVTHMKRVALFYHKLGASDSARQLLSDALDVVESRLGGKREMVSDLLYHLVLFLSDTLMEQMEISTPRTLMEPVYRLLKTAGRTVELLRSLDSGTSLDRLPAHLLLLCHHLIYYASHGGSAELTSRSSLEQAQEAAKEAADLFLALHQPAKALQALLVLSQAQSEDVFKQLDTLRTAEDICRSHFGSLSTTMLTIVKQVGELLETKVNNQEAAMLYYRQWYQVAVAVFGEEHTQSRVACCRVEELSAQPLPKV